MSDITKAIRDIEALTPKAQKACNLFMAECEKRGLNVLITETYRSQERQDYLYSLGRTRKGNKVTWTKSSRHTWGRAWDICKNVKGGEYSDTSFFKKCGEVAAGLGITWGGTWSTPDMPHFEIPTDWKGDEIDMAEFEQFKKDYASYVTHTSNIINLMGQEIESLKNIINIMGKELDDLRKEKL